MELSKPLTQSKMNYFIKVKDNGEQLPLVLFEDNRYKYLEIFFNYSENRTNLNWFESIKDKVSNLIEQSKTLYIGIDELETLNDYAERSSNILDRQIRCVFHGKQTVQVNASQFLLELVKYYNEVRLFTAFGGLDSSFSEIRIVEEDQVSIVIRKNKTLITGYFTDEEPLLIETSELLNYFNLWYNFIKKWQNNGIVGLTYSRQR
jgi:hypothetical protein